ncbi:MAG: SDR family oxidoreductase [Flavobacteriaceae bacterium]
MGKTIVITGASSGLGKATAEYLSHQGHRVIGTCREPKNYETPADYSLQALDVSDSSSIAAFVASLQQNKCFPDVLINNAGVGITGPAEEIALSEMRAHFETNFFGPIDLIQRLIPVLRKSKSAYIINITSIAAYSGLPFRSIYSASKGAFSLFSEALRMELKKSNIAVTTVAPGDYATDIASRRHHAAVLPDSPYKTSYGEALATMDAHVNTGSDPLIIAQLIATILSKKEPHVHHLSGQWLQKFSVFLKGILPSRWYEKLLMNHYNL